MLYSIRSERLLCEQLDYNLLFRWFVGLSMDDRIWDHSTFTKNRNRLIEAGVARQLRVRGYRSAGFMTMLTIGCHSLLRVAKLLPDPVPT